MLRRAVRLHAELDAAMQLRGRSVGHAVLRGGRKIVERVRLFELQGRRHRGDAVWMLGTGDAESNRDRDRVLQHEGDVDGVPGRMPEWRHAVAKHLPVMSPQTGLAGVPG